MTPKQREAWELHLAGMSGRAIAKHLGIAENALRNRLKGARKHAEADGAIQGAMSSVGMQDAGPLHSGWIKSEGASLYFQMPKDGGGNSIEDLAESIKASLADMRPIEAAEEPPHCDDDLLTIYPIADVHMGMYAWGEEVGEDYDTDIAEARVKRWMKSAIDASPSSSTAVILDVGDLHHADSQDNRTPQSKHQLDVATRHFRTADASIKTLVHCCDMALAKHEKVIVRILAGNHNPTSYMITLFAVHAYYRNEPRIDVQLDPSDFFIMRFGQCLLASHHGDKSKPERLIMAIADRHSEEWGKTKHRFLWTGHLHHLKSSEIGGMLWQQLRAVAPKDAYSFNGAYSGKSEIRAVTLHRDRGEVLTVVASGD